MGLAALVRGSSLTPSVYGRTRPRGWLLWVLKTPHVRIAFRGTLLHFAHLIGKTWGVPTIHPECANVSPLYMSSWLNK